MMYWAARNQGVKQGHAMSDRAMGRLLFLHERVCACDALDMVTQCHGLCVNAEGPSACCCSRSWRA
eukprot:5242354-Amphidinium_carterae.1